MDSPYTSPVPSQPSPQPAANLNTPELPHAPEKLLAPPHKTSWGALAGIVIIILVLIVGALYFWGAKLAEEKSTGFIPEESPATEPARQ